MIIKNIAFKNMGFIHCKSRFYQARDGIDDFVSYEFKTGINKLIGDIDSGCWAISYILSMYKEKSDDFIFSDAPCVCVNGENVALREFLKFSCYLDESYSLFKSKQTVRKLVLKGLKANGIDKTPEEIRDLFGIDVNRFERPLSAVGNERFRVMAAIGYCNKKQVYCFPWHSKMRFENYHGHMTNLLEILESLDVIVILPVGK